MREVETDHAGVGLLATVGIVLAGLVMLAGATFVLLTQDTDPNAVRCGNDQTPFADPLFRLCAPRGWDVTVTAPGFVPAGVQFTATEAEYPPTIQVAHQPAEGRTLREAYDGSIAAAHAYQGFQVITEAETALGGHPAIWAHYVTGPSHDQQTFHVYIVVLDDRMYSLAYWADTAEFASLAPTMEASAQTFSFR